MTHKQTRAHATGGREPDGRTTGTASALLVLVAFSLSSCHLVSPYRAEARSPDSQASTDGSTGVDAHLPTDGSTDISLDAHLSTDGSVGDASAHVSSDAGDDGCVGGQLTGWPSQHLHELRQRWVDDTEGVVAQTESSADYTAYALIAGDYDPSSPQLSASISFKARAAGAWQGSGAGPGIMLFQSIPTQTHDPPPDGLWCSVATGKDSQWFLQLGVCGCSRCNTCLLRRQLAFSVDSDPDQVATLELHVRDGAVRCVARQDPTEVALDPHQISAIHDRWNTPIGVGIYAFRGPSLFTSVQLCVR